MSTFAASSLSGTIDLGTESVAWLESSASARLPQAMARRLVFTARPVCEGLGVYSFEQLCWDGPRPFLTPVVVQRESETVAEFRLGAEREIDPDRMFGFVPSCVFKKSDLVYLLSDAEPSLHPGPRVAYVSPAFEAMTGYRHTDIVGKTPRILQGEKTEEEAREKIRRALKDWRPVRVQLTNYRKDGRQFRVEIDITPVHDRLGWYEYWFAAQRDITEEMKASEIASHQQKMESLGEIAAGVAHEVNTPMQCISSNLSFLQDCCDLFGGLASAQYDTDSEELVKRVGAVLRDQRTRRLLRQAPGAIRDSVVASNRVIDIVQAMKSMSHPTSADLADVCVNEVVEQSMAVSRSRWKYEATVDARLSPEGPIVEGVSGELSQVVINLLVNAADAICERRADGDGLGRIVLRTAWEADHVVIEVEDDGPGIPEEIRDRIFDPFFTTKEVGKGSGQGLAIVFDIVTKRCGGRIEALPGGERGALFRVTLPRRRPSTPDESTTPASAGRDPLAGRSGPRSRKP